jgi:hypothetical protein
VLPEVNCTYWEPYRPYLRGDIVCRFEPDEFAGDNARDYTITAYMCRIENVVATPVDYQRDMLGNMIGVPDLERDTTNYLIAKREAYASGRADLCSGAVWETIYANPLLEHKNRVPDYTAD